MDLDRDSVLYVRAGDESDHPGGRFAEVCDGLHPAWRRDQCDPRPDLHLSVQIGNDGSRGGYGDRSGGDGAAGALVPRAYEADEAVGRGFPLEPQYRAPDADARRHEFSLTDLSGCRHGGDQQHDPKIRRAGPGVRAGAVRADPDGSGRNRDEVFPDRDLDRCGHGGGLHPDRRLQYGRGPENAGEEPVYPAAGRGGGGRRGRACDRGGVPGRADRYFRRGQRERVLHGFCAQIVPHLSVYGGVCLRQQGVLHLPAGDGQGGRVDDAVDGPGGRLRRRFRVPASAVLGTGRSAVLHAGVRLPDVPDCGGFDRADVPGTGRKRNLRHAGVCLRTEGGLIKLSLPDDRLGLPPALEIARHAYEGGGRPGGSGGDPDCPVAERGDPDEDLGVQDTAGHFRKSVDHGKRSIAAAVQERAGHVDHAEAEIAQAGDAKRFVTDLDYIGFLHEDPHDPMPEQIRRGNQQEAEDQHDQGALSEALFDAVNLSCADVLSCVGGEGGSQGAVRLLHDLFHAVCDGKRRHHGVSEAVHYALEYHAGDGDHGILQGKRQTEAEGTHDDRPVRRQLFFAQTEIRYPAVCVKQTGGRRDGLGDDGREGHAEDAEAEREHERQIQYHVDDACQDQEVQGRLGIAERPQDGGGSVVERDADDSGAGGPHVSERITDDIVRRQQEAQQRGGEENADHADCERSRDQDVEGIRDRAAHVFFVLCPEVLRHDDADTDRESGAQGKEQEIHGAAGSDRRQGVLAHKISHDNRVHHIVELLEKISDQQRQGKFQNVPCRAADGHIGYILGVHAFLSGRENNRLYPVHNLVGIFLYQMKSFIAFYPSTTCASDRPEVSFSAALFPGISKR